MKAMIAVLAVLGLAACSHDPVANTAEGGVAGAGTGAAIGCVASLPVGCAPGAALGAAIGGGVGGATGAASTQLPAEPLQDQPVR